MNPTMLNGYSIGYPISGDMKYASRDRPYEYMERSGGLVAGLLEQPMGMDYKYATNQLNQDGSCSTTNSQPILTPPQSGDESSSSIANPSSSSFTFSTLPKVSGNNPPSLDFYSATSNNFLPSNFNGASMTQTDRRPGMLHMPPLSPPFGYGHSFPPYSMSRAAMQDYPHYSAQRSSPYDHPFSRGPRGVLSLGPYASSVPSYSQPMAQHPPNRQEGPPFEEMSKLYSLVNAHHQPLNFDILASIPKGFFKVEDKWTCYRRNYFSVSCGFTFKSHGSDAGVYLQRFPHSSLEQVSAYAVSISAKTAAVANNDSETRGLVQHTPKRDKATESIPARHVVVPAPTSSLNHGHNMSQSSLFSPSHNGSCLPGGLEGFGHSVSQSPQTQATFERIQFQKATANNGKRRAQQQYFHVVVRLEVSINRPGGQDEWITIATKQSSPMVVRGRSPGHYKDNRRDSQTSMDPDGGSGHHGDGGGLSGYSLHPIGHNHPSSLGSTPGAYRHSHHHGSSFNHSSRQVDGSESSSNSPESSTLTSSPIKDGLHRSTYTLARSNFQDVCFDRVALSPILGKPNANQVDYHHSRKHACEGGNGEHYFPSALDASGYRNPSFDFSATSTQALCASS